MREPKPAARAHPSRRTVLATVCVGSLPLPTAHRGEAEPATVLCRRWLALQTESHRLMARWAKLEAFLAEHHGWFRLPDLQQRALPEAAELYEIDTRLGSLFDERATILQRLPGLKAEGRQAALLKLEVAARVLELEGRDEAYRVLTSATRDLKSLSDRR